MKKILEYPKISYNYDEIALRCIYYNESMESFPDTQILPDSAQRVYGSLSFPPVHQDRVYTMACFVCSIDGKVSFPDRPAGPVVAKANALDPAGAEADFWMLNLFRACSDVIIGGAGTLQKEPDGWACVFDQDLEDWREAQGKPRAPWLMICSLDGSDIPFDDKVFDRSNYIIHTSPDGMDAVTRGIRHPWYALGPYACAEEVQRDSRSISGAFEKHQGTAVPIVVTGTGGMTDAGGALQVLRCFGMQRAVVETPSYTHVLMSQGLLDEVALNSSGLFIGGDAVGLGHGMKSFSSASHPHTRMLSIHMHSPSFFYYRYRMVY